MPARAEQQQLLVIRDFLLEHAEKWRLYRQRESGAKTDPWAAATAVREEMESEGSAGWVTVEMWLLGKNHQFPNYCTRISLGQQCCQAWLESPWLTTPLHKGKDEETSH